MAAACDRRATGNQKRRNCSIHAREDGLVSVVPDLGRGNLRIVRWKAVERSRTPPGDAKTSIVRERPARDLLCFERPPCSSRLYRCVARYPRDCDRDSPESSVSRHRQAVRARPELTSRAVAGTVVRQSVGSHMVLTASSTLTPLRYLRPAPPSPLSLSRPQTRHCSPTSSSPFRAFRAQRGRR